MTNEASCEEIIVKRIGRKYQPVFDRLDNIYKNLLKKISEYEKTSDPRINELMGTHQRFWETVNIVSSRIGYEIYAGCERAGIKSARKSTLIPARCLHCRKLYLTRVPLSKTNINDVYYDDADLILKAKQKKYCSRKCANQAFYMRKKGIKKSIEGRICIVCGSPLPKNANLGRKTCSDKCRKKLEREKN